MRNIKLILAYDGTNYAGWQRQQNQPTIQQALEDRIAVMVGKPTVLYGAGRTDAGVHALAMTANFLTEAAIPAMGFRRGLNSLLPEDIRVLAAAEVALDFHARFLAIGKSYRYVMSVGELLLPTERLYCAQVAGPFDEQAARASLQCLVGVHDFSCFEATGSRDPAAKGGRGAVREIFSADIRKDNGHACRYVIEIAGDGFLRHMVRNIVGTVMEVGRGAMTVADFRAVLAGRDRTRAGKTAPARGLFLKEVFY